MVDKVASYYKSKELLGTDTLVFSKEGYHPARNMGTPKVFIPGLAAQKELEPQLGYQTSAPWCLWRGGSCLKWLGKPSGWGPASELQQGPLPPTSVTKGKPL